jgi:hypothetical protein
VAGVNQVPCLSTRSGRWRATVTWPPGRRGTRALTQSFDRPSTRPTR